MTWRLHPEQHELEEEERELVASAIKHFSGERYKLYAYVVMNDHVHVILEPLAEDSLQKVIHSWKSFTTNRLWKLGRVGAVWQREYYDRIVRDEDEFWEKVNYVMSNAPKRWFGTTNYKWAEWFPPG